MSIFRNGKFHQKEIRPRCFFISAMGAIFEYRETNFKETIQQLIPNEKVTDFYIVSDTACRFINNALNNAFKYDSYTKRTIQKLLTDNHAILTQNKTEEEQQIILAKLILTQQAIGLQQNNFFAEHFRNKISVMGLITSKKKDEIIELQFPTILP